MKKEYQLGEELPKAVGECADLYKEVRDLRLAMSKETDAVAEREKEIKNHIINNLSKSSDTGAAGLRYRAQIKQSEVPVVNDWDKLWAYIVKYKRFDLLQKRIASKAVEDIWEADQEVPGVGTFTKTDVSITKIK